MHIPLAGEEMDKHKGMLKAPHLWVYLKFTVCVKNKNIFMPSNCCSGSWSSTWQVCPWSHDCKDIFVTLYVHVMIADALA